MILCDRLQNFVGNDDFDFCVYFNVYWNSIKVQCCKMPYKLYYILSYYYKLILTVKLSYTIKL